MRKSTSQENSLIPDIDMHEFKKDQKKEQTNKIFKAVNFKPTLVEQSTQTDLETLIMLACDLLLSQLNHEMND